MITGRPSPRSWETHGGNIKDEFTLFENHQITVGADHQQKKALEKSSKENESYAGFIQDKWSITPSIVFTGGLRYEYWNIWFANKEERIYYDPSEGSFLKKDYNQVIPKAFLTCALDKLSESLRDTSVSIGVSTIWTPISYCAH